MNVKRCRGISLWSMLIALTLTGGCSPSRDLARAEFDVYYFLPKDSPGRMLGTVKGLDSCGSLAWSQAHSDQAGSDGWAYVCCLVEGDNRCVEKHR